jgi:hypothetical protein
VKQFLASLRENNFLEWWVVTKSGEIRNVGQRLLCPIEFVAEKNGINRTENTLWKMGERIGLYKFQTEAIMLAADRTTYSKAYNPQLRQELLDALNLTERS